MKKRTLLLFSIALTTAVFAQQTKFDSSNQTSTVTIPTVLTTDTLKVPTLDSLETPKAWYMDNNMPWIMALIISTLGILANVYITNRQIRATLNTTNRQAWVNETRNVITDLMTQAKLLNIEFQENPPDRKREKEFHESVTQNRTKLLLLLKPDKASHKELLSLLTEFINTLDEHLLNSKAKSERGINIPFDNMKFSIQSDKIIESGRALLYEEWGKIQSIV
ncbi:MAG: hypothetical protein U0289_05105 [Cyclobacteriaceae bacterium]